MDYRFAMLNVSLKNAARTIGVALVFVTIMANTALSFAQDVTPTPGVVNLQPLSPPTADPAQNLPTATPMPTQTTLIRIEARDFANVRLEPDTSAPQIGTIRAGETFTVLARHISWIQFQYPSSPNGRGWVYGELVNVTGGDISSVPELADPYGDFEVELTQQAQGPASAGQATLAQLVMTPGSIMTVQSPVVSGAIPTDAVGLPTTPRPTFTYPPGLIAMAPTQQSLNSTTTSSPTSNSGLAPIVPIVVLGGIGVIGLLIGSLRRGG